MEKTTDQMVRELYTVILGVNNTDEKGMVYTVKKIERHLNALNGTVKSNTAWRKALCWAVGIMGSGMAGLSIYLLSNV